MARFEGSLRFSPARHQRRRLHLQPHRRYRLLPRLPQRPALHPHQHLHRHQQEHQLPPRRRPSTSPLACSFRLAITLASAASSSREALPSISSFEPSDPPSLSSAFPMRWLIRSWSCTVQAHLPPSPTTTGWTIRCKQLSSSPPASRPPTISNRRLMPPRILAPIRRS